MKYVHELSVDMHRKAMVELMTSYAHVHVWRVCVVALWLVDAHLGNITCRITVTMTAPLLLISGPVRYEVVLPHWNTIPPTP